MPETIAMSDIPDSVKKIQQAGYTLEELFTRKEVLFTAEELKQINIDCVNGIPGSEEHTSMWQYGLAVMLVRKQKEQYEQAMSTRVR